MDATTIFNKNQASVNLKKLAKGYSWEIKIYGDDIQEILTKIKKTDEILQKQYPQV